MKSIINRIFSIKTLLSLLLVFAASGAWADTLRVLGSDATICSSATTLDQSGFTVSDYTVSGTINFYTPAGCTAGDKLLFTKLEMLKATSTPNPATTITITVDGKSYTSGNVIETSAPSSLGNLTTAGINNCNLYTYNFPNVEVTAGQSYSVTFNMANNNNFRCRLENTASGAVFTSPVGSGWKPYGVVTVTKVLSSSPDVGDTILLSNTATSGTVSDAGAGEGNLSLTIPSNLGIPANSVVRIKKVNLAGWNNSFTDWDNTNHKSDPYFIKINNIKSLSLQGTTSDPGSAPSINLQTAKIQGNATTSLNRLSFEYSVDCDLTVGTTYPAATGNNASTGVALLYRNGNLCYGGGMDQTGVRYVTADSASVLSSAAASGAYPIYEMYAEVISIPTETATISAAGTYTLADLFTSVSASGRYEIDVNESATLNIDAATTVANLTFNVASGKTLTLTGSALTVDNGLRVTGEGYANLTDATVSGTLKGDGTVVYTGTATPSGLVFTDTAWGGTLWLENKADVTAWEPTSYGSANSTIRMTGIQLYFNTEAHKSSNVSFDGTLEVTDTYSDGTAAEYGIYINNGWSDSTATFGKLKGSGTIKDLGDGSNAANAKPLLVFKDAAEFEGAINLTGKKRIRIGTSGDVYDGEVYIAAGQSVTVAPGKTWTSNGGFYVLGTLTLGGTGSTLSGDVNGSGTVVCNQVDLSGSGFDSSANYGWTGKVQIAGDTVSPATSFDESAYGNADSTLEIVSGHVAITEATTLPGTVNVASGATLYMTSSSITDLSISGTNSGTINLQMANALTTLTLGDGIARGTIVYPSSLTTLNVALMETIADDGEYSVSCGSATPTAATLTLTRPDGTTVEEVTGTIEGSTVSFSWTPAVSGKACWIAYEMDYESGNASKTGFENSGTDTTGLHSDSGIEGDNAFYNGMLYTYAHPWRDMTGDNTYPSSWTAVVRCTVPAYENAAIITFGTVGRGLIGLVAGADPETQMKLVKTTGNSAFTVLSTMTVQNATTAQHVYVFEVENNSTIKVYCDGEEVLNETYSAFTLGGGIQVGSVHGGVGNTGIIRFAKNESPANTLSETVQKNARIDCVRLYKSLLGPNAIRQLSVEFPAVKLFRATVADGATTDWDSLSWTPAWDGGNEFSKIILTVEGDASLTLPSSITAEDFKIDVASGHVLTLNRAAGGTTITTTNPMEIDNGTMYLADDTSLGTWEIGGTGTVRLKNGAMVTGALSGTAKVEIPSGSTVGVMGGSIANQITGSGVLAYMALPSALSFSSWTGTVQLPAIASGGIIFNNYGTTGSTVYLTSMSGAWINPDYTTINPKLYIGEGGMTLAAMSTRTYTFAEIDGPGNLSFATSAGEPTVNITKVAEGYSGTISSTLSNPVTIATLVRPDDQVMTGGTKLLTTSGNVSVSALTLGTTPNAYVPVTLNDGIYVKYGSSTLNGTVTYHNTVDDAVGVLAQPRVNHDTVVTILDPSFVAANYQYASTLPLMGILWNEASRSYSFAAVTDRGTNYETIAAAIEGGVTAISLNRSVTEDVTLPVGTTIALGSYTLTGTVSTEATGYEISLSDGVWSLVDNTASTWTGAASDGSWTNGENWSTGFKPSQYTTVTFPSEGAPWTVDVPDDNGNAKCAAMVIDGDTTVAYTGGSWASLWLYGGVTGDGVLTLNECGLSNKSGAALTIATPVVSTASDNCYLAGDAFTFSDSVTVSAGQLKAEYTSATFGETVTINNSANVKANGSGSSLTFNGGIDVPANASASLQESSGAITIASTVTLESEATLTIPNSAVVSGATFVTTESGKKVVASVVNSTTSYGAQIVSITDDSEDAIGYWENSTAVITNTTSAVTIPDGATSVDLSFSTGSEITLTSENLDLATSGVTVYATDAYGAKTATDITDAFKVTAAGADNTYTVELDPDATVDGVSVKPEVDTAAETAPMAFDSTAPVFTIKTIPGLWYTVASGADLESLTNGEPQQADESSETLTAPDFTGTVRYYKVTVAPSKAALQ